MLNLKKLLFVLLGAAVLVSPLIPFARATSGQWGSATATVSWDYDLYRVERLAFASTMQGPFAYNDGVFVSQSAQSCTSPQTCELMDITFLKDGQSLQIQNVLPRANSPFWHSGQDGRFIYVVSSMDKISWGTVFEYDPTTGMTKTLGTIDRQKDDFNFLTTSVDANRIYSSIIHKDQTTGAVETKLTVKDIETNYTRDDITWNIHAPWQEIVDVREGLVLAKFRFDTGYQQLILIDEVTRVVTAIPETWTAPDGSLIGAHFFSDGTIQYFQNYRLYTYTPGANAPVESGGAYLNWFMDPEDAVQFMGDRMAYVDPENTLYVTSPSGVANFGKALSGVFTLQKDAIYYQTLDGPMSYTFSTGVWKTRHFHVTDTYEDIYVGVDTHGNVWYENQTTGKTVNFGFGSNPVLTDREHAVWKGTDGAFYQVTFASILDLGAADVEAIKSFQSDTVYLISDGKIWLVQDEAVYFSWFDTWDSVINVSPATLAVYLANYTPAGVASFAPGTRVKAKNSPKVYIAGSDGALHWIVSEVVAYSIYGSSWNKGIIEVQPERLWNYSIGSHINSHQDIKQI